MRIFCYFGFAFACVAMASFAHGHGTPIQVSASDELVVSGGLGGGSGLASNMFLEDDEDGEPFGEVTIPSFGPVILWQIPGFEISGMNDDSSLSLEVLIRPVADASPPEERTLWFWNPQTEMVEPAAEAASLHLLARGNQSRTLLPTDLVPPPPLLLSDPMTDQQGFHNHGLLSYAIDNDPAPRAGAYGFFARLLSDSYAPSDPFLVVLNRGITDYDKMPIAAQAINDAVAGAPLPGDYDANGQVNADDYTFWRTRFGNSVTPLAPPDGNGNGLVDAADYVIWRDAVGEFAAAAQSAIAVPEPGAGAMAWAAVFFLSLHCHASSRIKGQLPPERRASRADTLA